MAKFANPRKRFNFSITITPDPINPFLFQKVALPDIEIEPVAHGDTNHDIKTPGRVSYGNIVCEKLLPSNVGDSYMWSWLDACQSSVIGGGSPPAAIKKVLTIEEFAEDGSTILNTWIATGAWPCRIPGSELDRNSSDNTIENVEFCIDKLQKV